MTGRPSTETAKQISPAAWVYRGYTIRTRKVLSTDSYYAWVYRNTGDYGFPVCDKKPAERREHVVRAACVEIDNHYQADEELPSTWGRV